MTHPHSPFGGDPTRLRSDALAILKEALRGVDPARLVAEALTDDPELERWTHALAGVHRPLAGEPAGHEPPPGSRTVLVAVGKAGLAMTRGALHVLGDLVDEGLVLVP
ncbi:MAG TPA: DUF4147 domain-containing protein, partial [Longimicrobiales bacterium]|nr:DUF4147 domain-containing protein [Longimicrobiales bacterium]